MSKESKVRRGDLCGPQEMRMGGSEDWRMCSVVELGMRWGSRSLGGEEEEQTGKK